MDPAIYKTKTALSSATPSTDLASQQTNQTPTTVVAQSVLSQNPNTSSQVPADPINTHHGVQTKSGIVAPALCKTMQKIVNIFKTLTARLNPPKPELTPQQIAARRNRQNTIQNREIIKESTKIYVKTLKKLNSSKRPPNESPEVKLQLLEKAISKTEVLITEVEVKNPHCPIGNNNKETLISLRHKQRELKKLHHEQLHVVIQHQLKAPNKERLGNIAKFKSDLDRIDNAIRDLTPETSTSPSSPIHDGYVKEVVGGKVRCREPTVIDDNQMHLQFSKQFHEDIFPQAKAESSTKELINKLQQDKAELLAAANKEAKDVAKHFDQRCSELTTKARALHGLNKLPDEGLEAELKQLKDDFKDWQKGCDQLELTSLDKEINKQVVDNIGLLEADVKEKSKLAVDEKVITKKSSGKDFTDNALLYTTENGKDFRVFDPTVDSKEMEINEKLFTPEELTNPADKPSKKYLAKRVMSGREGEVSQKAHAMKAAGYELKAHAFEHGPDGKISIRDGEVHPTAASLGTKDEEAKNHLENSYEFVTEDNRIILRSGKISTKERADEFVALIKQKVAEMEVKGVKPPIRLVSEQVNSYGFGQDINESTGLNIVEEQHRWMVHVNNELSGVAEVVHVNIQSNAAVTNAERFGALESAGILPGERLSHEQNVEGLSKVTEWALTDVAKALSDKSVIDLDTKVLNAQLEAMGNLKDRIDELVVLIHGAKIRGSKVGLKELEVELTEKRNELKGLLMKSYETLGTIEEGLKDNEALKATLQKVVLMKMVLGVQLEMPGAKMSRGQEGMVMLLLYKSLGISTSLNCKSGCDRSGFWFAAAAALESMGKEVVADKVFDMVVNWDTKTALMNKGAHFVAKGVAYATREDEDIARFRNHVLKNLLTFGLQVTATSTGVMGLKWNKGFFEENLIPLNFLPPIVSVKKSEGRIERVQLVSYNKNGEVRGITRLGSSLITKFQDYRGS